MVNQKLIDARKRKFMTQTELAEKAGVTVVSISRWENGIQQPRDYAVKMLCQVLEASPVDLGLFANFSEDPGLTFSRHHMDLLVSTATNTIISEQPIPFDDLFSSFPLTLTLDTEKDWPTWFALKQTQLLTTINAWNGRAERCHELQQLVDQEIQMFNDMQPENNDDVYSLSRRQAIIAIGAYPLALLATFRQSTSSISVFLIEELLSRCAASTTACWHLLRGSELSVVDNMVSGYLPTLIQLAGYASKYQKAAARIVSQAYRLKGIVTLHQNNVNDRERYCQRALHYSEISEDPSSIVAALISLASTSYYAKNHGRAEKIYLKARAYTDKIPPLQYARLSVELAVVNAQQGKEQEALQYLEHAQKAYPNQPEKDPSFLYAEFTPASMILEEGLTYLALAQYYPQRYSKHAWETFARIEQNESGESHPKRIVYEITNQQAATALLLNDQELFQHYLQRGIQGAALLNSNQRRQEAIEVFRNSQILWPDEEKVAKMAELFLA